MSEIQPKIPPKWRDKEEVMYTEEDAEDRLRAAWGNSLTPDLVTLSYLMALRNGLLGWLQSTEQSIRRLRRKLEKAGK